MNNKLNFTILSSMKHGRQWWVWRLISMAIHSSQFTLHMAENEKRITKWQNWPTPEARGCGPIQFVAEPRWIGSVVLQFSLILYLHQLGSWKAIALSFWLLDLVVVLFRSSHSFNFQLHCNGGVCVAPLMFLC